MHGYSSSEESDDPRRPKPQPNNNNNNNDNKKKQKKPKPPPQKTINHIWKTFQNKKFNKALAVLPFDPVAPPAGLDLPNEYLSAGYERAAHECKRKVKKIIQECRRVNTRYRDPGWDLDWDLKWEKGNCLNSLGQTKWSVSRSSLANPNATVPKAVKRVHEIFDKPTFMKDVSGNDVKQGSLGNCWLIASLTALTSVPGALERICVAHDTKIGIYGFVFYRDGEWIYSIVDDKLYLKSPAWDSRSIQRDLLQQIDREDQENVYRKTYQTGSKSLFFGQCKDPNETWVPLLEKAYAKAHGDYASLNGGWTGEALEDLTGGVTTEMLIADVLDTEAFWENELTKVNEEFMFGFSTGLLECGYGDRDGISEGHAYVLMDTRTLKSGERLLKLRNPWGKIRKGIWEGAWSDGSKEWTPEVVDELGHQFGNDSVFWISYDDFLNKFQHFDRTRLFRNPEWRCAQRWIGVDVPWKAQYNEKFQFTLTKDSPFVLALSQLDTRYFKGLHGQYNFRMHFRIHEKSRLDSEDYFVRSHGNYLMDRSVSIEIPDMPAGEYSVFISVTAERDTDVPSVEQVVKRECKQRSENDKLAQVGYAYDLAHSKGAAHLNEVNRLRQEKSQQKASKSRQNERRKLWERRHMNRQISRKQKEKNAEKAELRKERREEQKRQEEEQKPKDQSCQTEDGAVADTEDEPTKAGETKPGADTNPEPETKVDGEGKAPSIKTDDGGSGKDAPQKSSNASRTSSPKRPRKKVTIEPDGDSSDSPVEDWEELYSDDDMVRKPRLQPAGVPLTKKEIFDSEDEDAPEPWNAICILGVRVYTMDPNLDLRVVMEGGDFAQGGMGKRGAADIDNAQTNAGGWRERDDDLPPPISVPPSVLPTPDPNFADERTEYIRASDLKPSDFATPSRRHKDEFTDDGKSEKSIDSADYIKLDAGLSGHVVQQGIIPDRTSQRPVLPDRFRNYTS